MDFRIKLYKTVIEIHSLYDLVFRYCEEYLTQDSAAHITVTMTQADIDAERVFAAKELGEAVPYTDRRLEINAVHRKIAIACVEQNMFMMHGSVVAVDNCAYMFTALSGTGKSTHTGLWLKNIPGSFIVNGDKPFLHVDDEVTVFGTPWCGKEHLHTNTAVPLKAIVLLERGTENEIAEISFQEAFPTLLAQSFRSADQQHLSMTLMLMQKAAQSLRFYRLKCNMEDDAALVAYNALHHN